MHLTAVRPHPIPIPIAPVPRSQRPILDAERALSALGVLAGAAERRCLPDLLDAWREYVEACNRVDLLLVAPRFPAELIELTGATGGGWTYLVDQALATARNRTALDAERHWHSAASAFKQAAANAATVTGLRVAHGIKEWERAGWTDDEDGVEVSVVDVDLLVEMAERAAHLGHVALGDHVGGWTEADRAESRARHAVNRLITTALEDLDLLETARLAAHAGGDLVTVCKRCNSVDGHTKDCPLDDLSAWVLLKTYFETLRGGGR